MLLIAVAIVFVALGWHSAATSGQNPDEGLEAAGSSAPKASPTATSPSVAAGAARLCVINAGSITGLASEVSNDLKQKGFRTATPTNYSGSSFTENTIFYDDPTQQAEAKKVADALGNDASVEERPSSFTMCRDGIPVVVVTR